MPARAIIDRILAALAVLLGTDLPVDSDPIVVALLVVMAIVDGVLRYRERRSILKIAAEMPDCEHAKRLLESSGVMRRWPRWLTRW